jgi:hypothetical protein
LVGGQIAGVLTATNIQFIFEPDLDDPAVRQRGVLHYTISFDLNKIVGCDLVNIDNPQLNTEVFRDSVSNSKEKYHFLHLISKFDS